MKENSADKEKIIKSFKKSEPTSIAVLGQYVPVHKVTSVPKNKVTSPVEKTEPKFCIYDGDYLKQEAISRQDLYGKIGGNLFSYLKYLFLNLPIINFLFLKIKQSKIRESISTLDSINEDVDKIARYFEGKSIVNEKKYQKICEELIKANNIQSQIKKDILEKF